MRSLKKKTKTNKIKQNQTQRTDMNLLVRKGLGEESVQEVNCMVMAVNFYRDHSVLYTDYNAVHWKLTE